MPSELLHCPHCGSIVFYLEYNSGLVFFHVRADLSLAAARTARTDPSGLDPETINCASCSWSGRREDLVP